MKRMGLLFLTVLLVGALCFPIYAAEKYPYRDITDVVVWGAGGGTDVCNRVITGEMAKILKVNINVINKTGGIAGSIGMNYVQLQRPDGYTLCGLSESNVTAGVQGGWDKRFSVWYPFIVGGSPDVISITPNSEYKTLADLLKAAKEKPGTIRAGAAGAGSIHHLNLLALQDGTGAKFQFIPYPGSAPAQTAAMTGEITVIITSLAEQQQLIRGGKLRPLAMLVPDAVEVPDYGKIPSAFPDYPELKKYLPIMQAIGFAVTSKAPASVKKVLSDAFKMAMATPKVQTWAKENFYLLSGKSGPEASALYARLESLFCWALDDLKATTVSPEALGIPKPVK